MSTGLNIKYSARFWREQAGEVNRMNPPSNSSSLKINKIIFKDSLFVQASQKIITMLPKNKDEKDYLQKKGDIRGWAKLPRGRPLKRAAQTIEPSVQNNVNPPRSSNEQQ